jgi:hypothetical protein
MPKAKVVAKTAKRTTRPFDDSLEGMIANVMHMNEFFGTGPTDRQGVILQMFGMIQPDRMKAAYQCLTEEKPTITEEDTALARRMGIHLV